MFQLTAARRRLEHLAVYPIDWQLFQLTAARRRLGGKANPLQGRVTFQLTAARRRLVNYTRIVIYFNNCFNSQPPGGGWAAKPIHCKAVLRFNSQPPGGGWKLQIEAMNHAFIVSTHSRPEAAGASENL